MTCTDADMLRTHVCPGQLGAPAGRGDVMRCNSHAIYCSLSYWLKRRKTEAQAPSFYYNLKCNYKRLI